MKDRSEELSTADLAGPGAGSDAGERADRDDGGDRTAERHDGFPGDRTTDAGYADGRDAYAPDRAYADDSAYPEDRAYADDAAQPGGYVDGAAVRGGRGGNVDDAGMSGGRGGHADDAGMSGGRGGHADDAGMAGGRGGYADDEPTMTTDRSGYPDGAVDDRAGYGGDTAVGRDRTGYADDAALTGPGSGFGRTDAAGNGVSGNGLSGNGVSGNGAGPLLGSAETEGFRARWTDVQTGFVDEPRRAVEQADGLTAELMQHLARSFADERLRLERQWDRGEDIPTDDLRTAFQRYRSFFERLLST